MLIDDILVVIVFAMSRDIATSECPKIPAL